MRLVVSTALTIVLALAPPAAAHTLDVRAVLQIVRATMDGGDYGEECGRVDRHTVRCTVGYTGSDSGGSTTYRYVLRGGRLFVGGTTSPGERRFDLAPVTVEHFVSQNREPLAFRLQYVARGGALRRARITVEWSEPVSLRCRDGRRRSVDVDLEVRVRPSARGRFSSTGVSQDGGRVLTATVSGVFESDRVRGWYRVSATNTSTGRSCSRGRHRFAMRTRPPFPRRFVR